MGRLVRCDVVVGFPQRTAILAFCCPQRTGTDDSEEQKAGAYPLFRGTTVDEAGGYSVGW